MKNIRFYNTKKRFTALVLAGTMFATAVGLSGCNKKDNDNSYSKSSIVTTVEDTNKKIDYIIPELGDEITNNTSILLLLDLITKKDKNGKISPELISELKSKIDSDNMLSDFNSFLDVLQQKMLEERRVIKVSDVLPESLKNDKIILSNIESMLSNVIKYSNEDNKDQLLSEFNKIYLLFTKGTSLSADGNDLKITDLDYSSRAVANTYGEVAAYFSRNYITEEQYETMDKILDDQNSKGYIKTDLEILSNQIVEKSEVNVVDLFNKKYEEVSKLLDGKVNLSNDTIKNLVNYTNMKYLNSDKVSTKDKDEIFGEYSDSKINDVILGIDAINEYNFNHQNAIIPFSSLLVDEHLKTDIGKTDKVALDFTQYNTIKLFNTKDSATTNERLRNNPYFENVFKYFTKDNFTHIQKDETGTVVENNIIWQEISDGANFVNYEVILYTLGKLPEVENLSNYKEKTQMNLVESIKVIQQTITGECKTTDFDQFVKVK